MRHLLPQVLQRPLTAKQKKLAVAAATVVLAAGAWYFRDFLTQRSLAASLQDGPGKVTLGRNGELFGIPNLDRSATLWVRDALRTGRLEVLTPATLTESASADLARRIDDASLPVPPSHLLLAVLYARENHVLDAIREANILIAMNPDSALARHLRDSLPQP